MANHLDMILALEIDVKMECKLALKIDANMQRARLDRAARSEGVGFRDGVCAHQEARCVAERSQQITVVVPVLEWLVVHRIKFLLCATTWTHNMIRRTILNKNNRNQISHSTAQ